MQSNIARALLIRIVSACKYATYGGSYIKRGGVEPNWRESREVRIEQGFINISIDGQVQRISFNSMKSWPDI